MISDRWRRQMVELLNIRHRLPHVRKDMGHPRTRRAENVRQGRHVSCLDMPYHSY